MASEPAQRYRVLDLAIDVPRGTVDRGGERIALPPKTFELLVELVRRAPGVVRRHDLLDAVWPDEHVTEQTLSRRVLLLRHALGDDAAHPRYVAGERGWGYRLVPPVEPLPPVAPGPRGASRPLFAGATLDALAAAVALAALSLRDARYGEPVGSLAMTAIDDGEGGHAFVHSVAFAVVGYGAVLLFHGCDVEHRTVVFR